MKCPVCGLGCPYPLTHIKTFHPDMELCLACGKEGIDAWVEDTEYQDHLDSEHNGVRVIKLFPGPVNSYEVLSMQYWYDEV